MSNVDLFDAAKIININYVFRKILIKKSRWERKDIRMHAISS